MGCCHAQAQRTWPRFAARAKGTRPHGQQLGTKPLIAMCRARGRSRCRRARDSSLRRAARQSAPRDGAAIPRACAAAAPAPLRRPAPRRSMHGARPCAARAERRRRFQTAQMNARHSSALHKAQLASLQDSHCDGVISFLHCVFRRAEELVARSNAQPGRPCAAGRPCAPNPRRECPCGLRPHWPRQGRAGLRAEALRSLRNHQFVIAQSPRTPSHRSLFCH